MRRLMFVVVAVIASALYMDAHAQHIVKKRIGTYKENDAVVMSDATTTFAVKLVVEYDEFVAGPYARYAQKFLGTRASFVDRAEYRVVAADIALVEGDEHGFTEDFDKYHGYSASEPKISVDRMSTSEKSVESALREIERLESDYLELFYGRRVVNYETYTYIVPVNAESRSMTIARFSIDNGIVAVDNLAGDVVFLNITPSQMEYPANEEKGTVAIRYANNAEVSLCLGNRVLCSRVMPVYEFGETVMIVKPR